MQKTLRRQPGTRTLVRKGQVQREPEQAVQEQAPALREREPLRQGQRVAEAQRVGLDARAAQLAQPRARAQQSEPERRLGFDWALQQQGLEP